MFAYFLSLFAGMHIYCWAEGFSAPNVILDIWITEVGDYWKLCGWASSPDNHDYLVKSGFYNDGDFIPEWEEEEAILEDEHTSATHETVAISTGHRLTGGQQQLLGQASPSTTQNGGVLCMSTGFRTGRLLRLL